MSSSFVRRGASPSVSPLPAVGRRSPYSPPSASSGNSVVDPLRCEYVSASTAAAADRLFFDFFLRTEPSSCAAYASSVRAHLSFLSFFPFFRLFFRAGSASSKLAG